MINLHSSTFLGTKMKIEINIILIYQLRKFSCSPSLTFNLQNLNWVNLKVRLL